MDRDNPALRLRTPEPYVIVNRPRFSLSSPAETLTMYQTISQR